MKLWSRVDNDWQWLLAICLMSASTMLVFLNYPAVLPLLQEEWNLSSAQAGMIYASYQVGYIFFVVLLSTLTDYFNTRYIFAGSAIWAGVANLLFTFYAHGLTSALLFRTLAGCGLAGTYMPGLHLVSERFSRERRGRAVGFYVASFTTGATLSLLITGLVTAMAGWRTAFLITSFGPFIGGGTAFLFLKTEDREKGQRPKLAEIRRGVLGNSPALLMILGYVAHMWELFGMRGWIAAFLTAKLIESSRELTNATGFGASLSALVMIMGAISTASAGYLSDRFGRLRTITTLMVASGLCTSLIGWAKPLPFAAIMGLSLASSFLATADSSVLSTGITELVAPEVLGTAQALQSFLGFAAASLSPLVFGYILDWTNPALGSGTVRVASHWGWAFSSLGLGAVGGLLVMSRLKRYGGDL
ncbi:MAG: MFS transporter [Anaerolineae bacterium]